MSLAATLALAAAATSLLAALLALWRDRSLPTIVLGAGLAGLALYEALAAAATGAVSVEAVLARHRWRLAALAPLPAIWLAFSIAYARIDPARFLRAWRWPLVAAALAPAAVVGLGWASLLEGAQPLATGGWRLHLGPAGELLHVLVLLGAVAILINLESTLRASTGTMRWRVKFLLLGVGAVFAVEVYLASQALLYSSVATTMLAIESVAVLATCALFLVALARSGLAAAGVYLSDTVLYGSLTLVIVGVYLLAVGAMAKAATLLGGAAALPLLTFVVFAALVALAVVLVSDEAQQRARRWVRRHLKRPAHDYRRVWSTFTRRTAATADRAALCAAVATVVSETLGAPAVSLLLRREAPDGLCLGGSTALSAAGAAAALAAADEGRGLLRALDGAERIVDLRAQRLDEATETLVRDAEMRYLVPLVAGGELVGLLAASERVNREPLGAEDLDLLRTIGDQAAAAILNLRLSERLLTAKEMEAFQSLSAFFVHDLKNLASRLSLAMQNLPRHYDDPEFRRDLFRVMTQSVEKIQTMCSRLSPLSRELEPHAAPVDVNALVETTVRGLDGAMRCEVETVLRPVPRVEADAELVQKVLVNLLVNADEATGAGGHVRVETSCDAEWLTLAVVDDGPGMSAEFMAHSLFRPFQTTKKNGLGIGLYHSKKVVDAHGGRLEVASRPGEGSTFRIRLPLGAADGAAGDRAARAKETT